ncbi:hypothetical protein BDB00DRAFT_789640 [Zychaea mexicana]|uniref:uncharacterized protein n=1 Tax=Zychaea mexicana TaxID=64656 RepID=UPI0022FDC27F|nr:uncharacterized protein BDB00DRAFT_789640 [Zychaea mexicana]KAI9491386.1 hypothetical protein BDB00DRAFT_789640 [Zychaea mexicana]
MSHQTQNMFMGRFSSSPHSTRNYCNVCNSRYSQKIRHMSTQKHHDNLRNYVEWNGSSTLSNQSTDYGIVPNTSATQSGAFISAEGDIDDFDAGDDNPPVVNAAPIEVDDHGVGNEGGDTLMRPGIESDVVGSQHMEGFEAEDEEEEEAADRGDDESGSETAEGLHRFTNVLTSLTTEYSGTFTGSSTVPLTDEDRVDEYGGVSMETTWRIEDEVPDSSNPYFPFNNKLEFLLRAFFDSSDNLQSRQDRQKVLDLVAAAVEIGCDDYERKEVRVPSLH